MAGTMGKAAAEAVVAPRENMQAAWWWVPGAPPWSCVWRWWVWWPRTSLAVVAGPAPGQSPRYAPLAPASGMKPAGISARSSSAGST